MPQDPDEPTRQQPAGRRSPDRAAETPPPPSEEERRDTIQERREPAGEPRGAAEERWDTVRERRDTSRPAPEPRAATAAPPRPLRSARDPRAMVVAVSGLVAVLLIALVGFLLLPGPVAEGTTDTTGAYIVAIASAALTAVGTMVTAYVGVKAANVAREDTERASLRHEIRIAALAGAAPTAAAAEASREASEQIRELGL